MVLGMKQQHDMVHVSSAGSVSPSASSAKALRTSTLRLRSFLPLLLAFLEWPASCTCHTPECEQADGSLSYASTCSKLLTASFTRNGSGLDGLQSVPVGLLLSHHALASRSQIQRSSQPPLRLSGPGSQPFATLQTSRCPVSTQPHPKQSTVPWQSFLARQQSGESHMQSQCNTMPLLGCQLYCKCATTGKHLLQCPILRGLCN